MKLSTTLNLLHKAGACKPSYKKLVAHLGGVKAYGKNTPIDLLVILDLLGPADCLWCTTNPDKYLEDDASSMLRLMAADFAERVLHVYEARHPGDDRPRLAIQAAREYARGEISEDALKKARDAADAAYASAADAASAAAADASAAYAAASDAAYASAYAAAYAAAAYAAYADAAAADASAYAAAAAASAYDAAAAASASERKKQALIIRKYLSK